MEPIVLQDGDLITRCYDEGVIRTPRLVIEPSTILLAEAEIADRHEFARLLGATVPPEWPPESVADALPLFLSVLKERPEWLGWLAWYARTPAPNSVLVGSIGFKGGPDEHRTVEMGYSVLPQFQRRGYATEMASALLQWAFASKRVDTVLAQTTNDNVGSRTVLLRLGFRPVGLGVEDRSTLFAVTRPPS